MLNWVLKIAVTGGIASGKSSVCRFFKELGAHVVSADHIAHKLLSPSTSLGKQVIDLLGKDIVENHQFNRQAIAKKVFDNQDLLLKLENLLHPQIEKEIENEYVTFLKHSRHIATHIELFVAEVPLLFEKGLEKNYDMTILVTANLNECEERYNKNHPDKNDFTKRSSLLLSQDAKIAMADKIIKNNGSIDDLQTATKKLFEELTKSKIN